MPVATYRRPARLSIPHPARRSATPPIEEIPDPTAQTVYDLLSEAADLVTLASRQLRYAKQTEAGFALQPISDELHEHIRRLPSSVSNRPGRCHDDAGRSGV